MQKTPHNSKDIITKDAIQTLALDIALYILKLNIKDLVFVDKELKRIEKREADIVAKCKIDGVEEILHIEIQNNNDSTMHRRMLRYYSDIKSQFEKYKVNQYVIYIGKAKLNMKDTIIDDTLNFSYNIIDMHNIDCEEFIKMDTPDALVLSILCDFKGKDVKEVLTYLLTRIKYLTKDDEHLYGKYMLMIETLSDNRDLKNTLEEVEDMLREINMENLPSYSLGHKAGVDEGISQGKLETASMMIKEFNLSIEKIAQKLNLSVDVIKEYIKNHNI